MSPDDQQKTLGTYDGIPMHHWPEELPLITEILEQTQPRLVVELGTMYGGFAAFLQDTIGRWEGRVVSIDWEIYPGLPAVLDRKGFDFIGADIDGDTVGRLLPALTEGRYHEAMLYVDSGHQSRMLQMHQFGHYFDLVGVHDFNTEVTPEACAEWATLMRMAPVHAAAFEALQAEKGGYFVSRFWAR